MSTTKTEYLALDGLTINDQIKRNLNSSGVFTDQNYDGSNLSLLNQNMAYGFSLLLYYLQQGAHDGSFSETDIYENMNKILKIQGYKPIGYQTSSVPVEISADSSLVAGIYTIPRFSYLQIGGIRFSIMDDLTFVKNVDESLITNDVLLQQGEVNEYNISSVQGIPNERFTLPVSSNNKIDHFNFQVYVKNSGKWRKWKNTNSLYIAEATDEVFEYRLNGNKQYEFLFGNDINGKKLQTGDSVAIYYLKTDGKTGEIGANAFSSKMMVQFKSPNFASIFNDTASNTNKAGVGIRVTNTCPSTPFGEMETVDEMREKAPQIYKTQSRLVTIPDFKIFIKTNFGNIIKDVVVIDNEEYLDTYMKYFWSMGVTKTDWESRALFNQLNFSDSCNFNNIYAFVVPKGSDTILNYLQPTQKNLIINSTTEYKSPTTELIISDPVYLFINIAVNGETQITKEDTADTVITIHLNKTTRRNDNEIKTKVLDIFKKYFLKSNCSLGQTIDVVGLTSDILALDDVVNITTDNIVNGNSVTGVSFLMWNPAFEDVSIKTFTGNMILEKFQFPYFVDLEYLTDRIVIK